MSNAISHVPQGLRTVTPQLVVPDAKKLVAFMEKAFGARAMHMMPGPDGKGVVHGFVTIGDCAVFVSDAGGFAKPTSANLFLYVPDVDATFENAKGAGCKSMAPPSDMFWGDRWGMVEDPFGNVWQLATHKEDVTPEEMQKRMKAGK
jgi:PhnB protein